MKIRPSVFSPTGTVIGAAGVEHLGAARETVGRVHRDRADAVVAEVLLDLTDEPLVDRGGRVDVLFLAGRSGALDP